ncbi:unnamed protein product [Musa acuminata subsp. malaccensis]|uniref:(wild Malaysian banana) hypothetical protein n=1 Tax=Musa acuminata subsp. malaccensis TaxID=214687 RepID=A0A804KL12_MUSAM|nr:unnamed protein product [Musa acuminata subsp. malaccensis]
MLSKTSCLGEWIIIISFPSLNKPSLYSFSYICPGLAKCIPDFFKNLVIYP